MNITSQDNGTNSRPTVDGENEIELSIVLPCLNEARTVAQCVDAASQALTRLAIRGEIIVADNGSTDGSAGIARAHGAKVICIHHRGYGSALRGGIDAALGKYVLMADADESYDLNSPELFLERLRAGDDLVVGNRFRGGILPGSMPWLHRYLGNPLLSGILNLLFATPVRDAHCGMRAVRAETFRQLELAATGMEFASEMVVKAVQRRHQISEVPIKLHPDGRQGPSHLRSFRDGWRHLSLLLALCPRWPLLGLPLLALAFVVGLVFGSSPQEPGDDAMVAPCWVGANAVLITAGWYWSRRLFPDDGYLELLVHTCCICWGSIVAAAFALGAVSTWLTGPALLLTVGGIGVAALASGRIWSSGRRLGPVPAHGAERWWGVLWATLGCIGIGRVVVKGLLEFPTDFDSLAYHIPLIEQWIQARQLTAPGCDRWFSPANNEVLAFWSVAPFSGDFLISLTNLFSITLFASGAVALATAVGLPRSIAHLGALAVVCQRVSMVQLVDAENDVAVAACFVATLGYAFRYNKVRQPALLMLGAISLGLLVGIKYYALGYAMLAFGVWVMLGALTYGVRASLRVVFFAGAGLLLFGGYWYLRNWYVTGSPLYPKEFFTNPDVLTQICPFVSQTSFFGNGRAELLPLFVAAIWEIGGLCQLAAFVLTPLTLVWLIGSELAQRIRHGAAGEARTRLVLALVLVGTALVFGMTPMAVEDVADTLNQLTWGYCPVRYGLCFLSAATLAALLMLRDLVLLLERRHESARRFGLAFMAAFALAGTVLFQLVRTGSSLPDWLDDLLIGFDLASFALGVVLVMATLPRLGRWVARSLLALLLPASALICAMLAEAWHDQYTSFYARTNVFRVVPALTTQRSKVETIVVLDTRTYAFFGSHRERRVRQPVYVQSHEWLVAYIDREQANFVVARLNWPAGVFRRFLHFDECLALHPERFRIVDENGPLVTVEVLGREASHSSAIESLVANGER